MEDEDARWELMDTLSDSVECSFCPAELDREDSKACVYCGRPICGDCKHEILYETLCPECCVCKVCGNEAVYACDRCSKLMCPDHIYERHYTERDTGYQENFLLCDPCLEPKEN
jgi:hypothetical protein